MELHGGRVWAESEGPDRGTRFVVRLPLLEAPRPKRILVVEDDAGTVVRGHLLQARLLRKSAGFRFVGSAFAASGVVAAHLPVASQPYAAFFYQAGDMHTALRMAEGSRDPVEQRFRVLARTAVSTAKAREALWTLFEHYSSHEELWRLGAVLEHLPYTLEEADFIAPLREAYQKQVGLLGPGCLNTTDYYRKNFDLAHAIDAAYIELGERALVPRCRWLLEQCRKQGLKRILEMGCTDGNNLFPMTVCAPDLDIQGVDVSEPAILHALELARQVRVPIRARYAESFGQFAGWVENDQVPPFDAVSVFEVLEHNPPAICTGILDAAEQCLRPGGKVFISTPCGAWSLHDETCWNLEAKKEHINVWTVKRMRAFLETRGSKDLSVERVPNTRNLEEANAWVLASYGV